MTGRLIIVGLMLLSAAGFVALALWSRRSRSTMPTLAQISGYVMSYQVGRFPVGRVALLGFWWWVGWHFFAR
ncbi:MAG TPA: DUF6186 family protein [Micromonosporaceae bacterium]